ncbi:hypothetical protein [Coprobacter fastidiosus]|uniref:hypothetical protein n=1 Tax=Coprobacter fastidiosus TaxID=1099853 RepID=UPI0032096773
MRSIILVTYEATSQEKAVLGRKREETLMNSWKEFNAIAIPLLIEYVNDEIVDKTGHAIVTFERVRFKQNIPFYRFSSFAEKGKNNRMSSFVDKLWNDKTLHEEIFKDTDDYLVRLEIQKEMQDSNIYEYAI